MALSNDLISQFVKLTNDKPETPKSTTAYGTVVESDGMKWVKLDGSPDGLLTPIETTTEVSQDDRVIVDIKDHTAVVTGNLTTPAINTDSTVKNGDGSSTKISDLGIVIADKVSTKELKAETARIDTLIAKDVEIDGKLSANEASINELDTKVLNVEETLTAANAEIKTLKGNYAEFETVKADYGEFKKLTVDDLTAKNLVIDNLKSNKLDAEQAELKYANIDFGNINEAAIKKVFSDSGIIKDLVVSEGHITGELVGVTIKGDLIEGGTVKADKLVVLGENGLYYKLNVNSLGETTAKSDPKYQNGLDGSVIVAKSITATKVKVTDLVAFGATIGGFHIGDHSVYSGVKSSATNTTRGVFLGDDGQIAFGDSNNFIKYYKDTDGKYKLAISAESLVFSANNKSVQDTIEESIVASSDEVRQEIVEQNASNIVEVEGIVSEALKTYTKTDDFNSFKETTESSIKQKADDISLNLTKTTDTTKTINEDLQTTKETISKHFEFDKNGLTIKMGENAMKLRLDNDLIGFYKGEIDENDLTKNRFGWWDGVDFHTGNIVVEVNERAQFGNFAFVPRSDGSLMFLKVGG